MINKFITKTILAATIVVSLLLCSFAVNAQTVLLTEDFSSITTGNSTTTGGSGTAWDGNENFPTTTLAYKAGGAVRIGAKSAVGSITSKVLDLSTDGGTFTVVFDVKGWTTVEGDIIVEVTNLASQTVTYTAVMADDFETKTVTFTGGQANSTIKIATSAKRAFIDNVVVTSVPTNTVSTPSFTPAPGTFTTSPITVALACSTEGATIKYSTESATGPWADYTAPISRTSTTTIWTYAEKDGMTPSDVVSGEYIINTEPTVNISANSLSGFAYQVGYGPSNFKTFKVSGTNLQNDVTVECFNGSYEASLIENENYTNTLTLPITNGTLEETTVYVRLKAGLEISNYSETIMCSAGPGGVGGFISCSGIVKEVSKIVISQVYGGGGNTGATFKNDFIELYNRSTEQVTLTGAYIKQASAAGTFNLTNSFALPELTLLPNQYYLIQCAGGTNGNALPTANFFTNINLSIDNGKVALTSDDTPPTSSTDENVIDFVGYGTNTDMFEGNAQAPKHDNSNATVRKNNGLQDTDNNNEDFEKLTPNPRNMATGFTVTTINDGDWYDANNWQPATVPSSLNNVIVQNNMVINSNVANSSNLKIESMGSVTINSTGILTVSNTLTNQNGNSGIIINSDAQGTGVLVNSTEDVPATINRYITGNSNLEAMKYHTVSIPLEVASPTSSLFMGCYLYNFNESTNEWEPLGESTTTALDNKKGYLIYYPNDNTTLPYEGILRTGNQSYNLGFTASDKGFNLVPNPYPTSIDWSKIEASQKVNMTDGFWIFSSDIGNYKFYNSPGNTGTTEIIIPLGQAIFVQANAENASLTFDNNSKYSAGSPILKNATRSETASKLHLRASANELADEIILLFDENWSNAQDVADMIKLSGSANAPQFSSLDADNRNLTLNALPLLTEDRVVPLALSIANNTEATISVKQIENFGYSKLYLVDKVADKEVELTDQTSYSFNYNTSEGDNRFELRCQYNSLGGCKTDEHKNIFCYQQDDFIIIDLPNENNINTTIQILNVKGQTVFSTNTTQNGVLKIAAPKTPGVYVINIVNTKENSSHKVVVK